MAKIQKRKLQWTASESTQVVGYKLYWAQDAKVDYDCPCEKLGNVTEVVLPDDVDAFQPDGGPVEFGVTAVDASGNESDLVTVSAPSLFNAPQAPGELWIEGQMDASSQPTREPVLETESHVSLLEHTIKGEAQPKTEKSTDPSEGASHVQDTARHFGRQ